MRNEESTVNDVPTIYTKSQKLWICNINSETDDIFVTTNTYRHYLFDVEMFTHVDCMFCFIHNCEIVSVLHSVATAVVASNY